MNNDELLQVIRDGDNSALMELWNQNSGLIRKACGKYARRIEEEDAVQECYFAFMDAVNDYDAAGGASFGSYLYKRCLWHLYRYAAGSGVKIRIPENRLQTIRTYQTFVRQWYQAKGEQPDNWTLKMYLGLSADDLDSLRADMRALNIGSLDTPISDDPEGGTAADFVQDMNADVEAAGMDPVFYEERKRAVWGAVDSLPDKEGGAIRMYYRQGLTYDQAAALSGVTRERIRQRIAKGIRRLRTEPRYKELRDFVDLSPVYGRAIRGTGSGTFHRTATSATEKTALWILEAEERWKREREELDRILEDNRRDREAYERRKAAREARRT